MSHSVGLGIISKCPFNIENVPTAEEYKQALQNLLDADQLNQSNLRVLRAQYQRLHFRTTSQQLRDALGFKGIGGSNRAYGAVAAKVANELGFNTAYPEGKRARRWRTLSTGDDSKTNFAWIMRPEVLQALEELGLVDLNEAECGPVNDPDIHDEPNRSAIEGRRRLVLHLERDRNQGLVKSKKEQATSLACEICGFIFAEHYGIAAASYCEAHHLIPLSEATEAQETKLEDLMLVCANCHRVIHLKNPPFEPEEVREMMLGFP